MADRQTMVSENRTERFRALALPELGYLHRVARALTPNRQEAEDLVQETMLRGLRYFDSYRGENFRAWMAAIMRNLHRDRPAVAVMAMDEHDMGRLPDPCPDPEQSLATSESAARLRGLVAALPERLQQVLVLREYGDLSYAQIAATLAVPIGTVMSRLAHARNDLRLAWFAAEPDLGSKP
jgi:RNA polymerase sigma-70 factor (ECF subfamily)